MESRAAAKMLLSQKPVVIHRVRHRYAQRAHGGLSDPTMYQQNSERSEQRKALKKIMTRNDGETRWEFREQLHRGDAGDAMGICQPMDGKSAGE